MFIPRNHRYYWTLFILMAAELPFTIVILTFTGIASHNRYRTKLWQDGYDNGFNSAPDEVVYALANYRSYKVPTVWSSFITNFNLVISVVSLFLLIAKAPMHLLKTFYPPLSAFIHGALVILYIVSARFQAGSDTSDRNHPQPGAPWYISKSCNVAADKSNIGYCQQAKSLFAFSIIVILIYFTEFVLSAISCFTTKAEREEHRERREEKRVIKKWEDEVLNSPNVFPLTPAPPTGGAGGMGGMGGMPTATPRTVTFNQLTGETPDLPLRDYSSSPNPSASTTHTAVEGVETPRTAPVEPSQAWFPPPPEKAHMRQSFH